MSKYSVGQQVVIVDAPSKHRYLIGTVGTIKEAKRVVVLNNSIFEPWETRYGYSIDEAQDGFFYEGDLLPYVENGLRYDETIVSDDEFQNLFG